MSNLRLGTSVFSWRLSNATFVHTYYELKTDNGKDTMTFSNGQFSLPVRRICSTQHVAGDESEMPIYYRRRESPWVHIGGWADFLNASSNHNYLSSEFGFQLSRKIEARRAARAQPDLVTAESATYDVTAMVQSTWNNTDAITFYPAVPVCCCLLLSRHQCCPHSSFLSWAWTKTS